MSHDLFKLIESACIAEAAAKKAGNVHPTSSFADTTYRDFVLSAKVIAEVWRSNPQDSIGKWIYDAVANVRLAVGKNTNLGIILVCAPLVRAAQIANSRGDTSFLPTHEVLAALDSADCELVYKAIRLASPGGLNSSEQSDVHDVPPSDLLEAMRYAASYDDIAKQYITNFADVYELATRLTGLLHLQLHVLDALRVLQIEWLAERIDTLIQRKNGGEVAQQIMKAARYVRSSGSYGSDDYERAWLDFDHMLRNTENNLNPGTTADLLAAAVFVCLLQNPSYYDSCSVSC